MHFARSSGRSKEEATVVKRQIRERGKGKWERIVCMEVNEAWREREYVASKRKDKSPHDTTLKRFAH